MRSHSKARLVHWKDALNVIDKPLPTHYYTRLRSRLRSFILGFRSRLRSFMLALIQTGLSCSCLLLGSYCPAVNTFQVFSNFTSFSGPVSFDLFSALIVDLQRQRLSLLLRISIL